MGIGKSKQTQQKSSIQETRDQLSEAADAGNVELVEAAAKKLQREQTKVHLGNCHSKCMQSCFDEVKNKDIPAEEEGFNVYLKSHNYTLLLVILALLALLYYLRYHTN